MSGAPNVGFGSNSCLIVETPSILSFKLLVSEAFQMGSMSITGFTGVVLGFFTVTVLTGP